MTRRKMPLWWYEKRILDLFDKFPKDSKIKVTELLAEAQNPYTEIKEGSKINPESGRMESIIEQYEGMSPNKFYEALNSLEKKHSITRFKTPDNSKEVYFTNSKNVKLLQLSETMIKEIVDPLLGDLRREVEKTITSELKYIGKEENLSKKEERAIVNEITNTEELKLTLGRILVKHGKELKKSAYRQPTDN